MVIIQQNTHKIVVVYETKRKYWFFPRGRKDVGESIEAAALREAYEEVELLLIICLSRGIDALCILTRCEVRISRPILATV
jgi:8-oxo-dGTP pyrophosphatase MutT (NUDIX family)